MRYEHWRVLYISKKYFQIKEKDYIFAVLIKKDSKIWETMLTRGRAAGRGDTD